MEQLSKHGRHSRIGINLLCQTLRAGSTFCVSTRLVAATAQTLYDQARAVLLISSTQQVRQLTPEAT